jgi:hypothetical protein
MRQYRRHHVQGQLALATGLGFIRSLLSGDAQLRPAAAWTLCDASRNGFGVSSPMMDPDVCRVGACWWGPMWAKPGAGSWLWCGGFATAIRLGFRWVCRPSPAIRSRWYSMTAAAAGAASCATRWCADAASGWPASRASCVRGPGVCPARHPHGEAGARAGGDGWTGLPDHRLPGAMNQHYRNQWFDAVCDRPANFRP